MRAFVPCVERPPYSRLPCDLPLLPFRARSSKRAVTCNNCNRLQTSELILSFRCGAAWCRIFFVPVHPARFIESFSPRSVLGLRATRCAIIDKFPKLLEASYDFKEVPAIAF